MNLRNLTACCNSAVSTLPAYCNGVVKFLPLRTEAVINPMQYARFHMPLPSLGWRGLHKCHLWISSALERVRLEMTIIWRKLVENKKFLELINLLLALITHAVNKFLMKSFYRPKVPSSLIFEKNFARKLSNNKVFRSHLHRNAQICVYLSLLYLFCDFRWFRKNPAKFPSYFCVREYRVQGAPNFIYHQRIDGQEFPMEVFCFQTRIS